MLIIFHKPEVISEVRPDPSPSHNDIQSMINSVLERQAKSTNKLLSRLIKGRDGKNLVLLVLILLLLTRLVLLKPIHIQVVGGTIIPNPSTQLVNHFHN
jgi:hypothetical protein